VRAIFDVKKLHDILLGRDLEAELRFLASAELIPPAPFSW
jgi:hypothetical protein